MSGVESGFRRLTSNKYARYGALVLAMAAGSTALIVSGSRDLRASAGPQAAAPQENVVALRRLTQDQYRNVIIDVFGPTIDVSGRFEPDVRQDGLLAVGTSRVSVTQTGLEQYDAMARSIATQVLDADHRGVFMPCKPASETAADDACAGQFFQRVGHLLYRRPLRTEEVAARVSAANKATAIVKDFYSGLSLSFAAMLTAPEFLFRQETAEADPDHPGQYHLTALSKASRLSFFLWNSAPDTQLLAAAESGELNTQTGLTKQVDRMLGSPRLEGAVRAFFTDMFQFDHFEELSKDTAIYPRFTSQAGRDAEEQTLRTVVDHLLTRNGDYRDLFTTRRTFLTPPLAAVYNVMVTSDTPRGSKDNWIPYEFAADDPRGAGILAQASFVALHSHPGRSSPTLRGKALREVLLCQKVPDPPANVNFNNVQDTGDPNYKTARQRVTAHRTDPTCAGCHRIMDPIGLAMENFDSSGGFRSAENGAAIDASGDLDGIEFKDILGLAKAVHDNPAATSCLVNRVYAYGVGRPAERNEIATLKILFKDFAADGYKFRALLRRVALNDAFYRAPAPAVGASETPGKQAKAY